ncbi:hypothetical protein TNCV_1145161 [Trichonephila clavipes]|nr:hypothetical protein TNCV_1145161 [Trichonephila clavipes]
MNKYRYLALSTRRHRTAVFRSSHVRCMLPEFLRLQLPEGFMRETRYSHSALCSTRLERCKNLRSDKWSTLLLKDSVGTLILSLPVSGESLATILFASRKKRSLRRWKCNGASGHYAPSLKRRS